MIHRGIAQKRSKSSAMSLFAAAVLSGIVVSFLGCGAADERMSEDSGREEVALMTDDIENSDGGNESTAPSEVDSQGADHQPPSVTPVPIEPQLQPVPIEIESPSSIGSDASQDPAESSGPSTWKPKGTIRSKGPRARSPQIAAQTTRNVTKSSASPNAAPMVVQQSPAMSQPAQIMSADVDTGDSIAESVENEAASATEGPLEIAVDSSARSSSSSDPARPHQVEVFYATDRKPIESSSGILHPRWWFPAGCLVICLGLLATAILTRVRIVTAGFAVVSLGLGIYTAHGSWIEYQQEDRLLTRSGRVYGGERHETNGQSVTELGICQVVIPPNHVIGRIESPSIFKLEFKEDRRRHVILDSVELLPDDEYFTLLKNRVDESSDRQAFVFVHGYNVAFDDAVKRTAQMAHDLKFDGAPICYSWPSKAMLAGYPMDEQNVRWTTLHFERFLDQVRERTGSRRIHLIAHSMGNRALLDVIERISLKHDFTEHPFGQIILAAPDVDTAELRDRYVEPLMEVSDHVTLYASANDRALQVSTGFHGYNRAGLSGEHRFLAPGIETIDVSPIDTSLIGHSYYGDHPLMIDDMRAIIELATPAHHRDWLEVVKETSSLAYWVFRDGEPAVTRLSNLPGNSDGNEVNSR